ncbi:MAG: Ig-like domain-containing protein [Streptomycetales bacterium]
MALPRRFALTASTAATLLAVAACGGSGESTTTTSGGSSGGEGEPTVTITSPQDGATVSQPFTLKFDSSVPIGAEETGRDHVHVFADGEVDNYEVVTSKSQAIDSLEPGEHTIGVTLQHADHSSAGAEAEITVMVEGSGGGSGGAPKDDGGQYDY